LDANGIATSIKLPIGLLIRVTDSAGNNLLLGYDNAGRIVKATDPSGGQYTYTYGGPPTSGNLTSVKYPDGKTRTYLYGEAANVSATPNAGVSYAHALTGIIDENGTRYASWTYDAAGRATSSEHGAFGSGIDHVGLVYTAPDANGNSTTAVTDPRGNIRTYTFSTILGVVKNTGITGQPCNGCSAAFTYDANGNVSSRADFNGNKTCYAYDLTRNLETVRLEGLPSATACPANLATYVPSTVAGSVERKISTVWLASYRLPTAIAEPLRLTSYSYDIKGNLQTRTVQPTSDATGGAGQSAAAAGTARTTSYTYNTAGQVLTVDGARTDVSDITTYSYDPANGNLLTVSNALTQITTLGNYDANGRVGSLTDPNGLITNLTYDARGGLTSRSAGGETTYYTYDGVGQLKTVTAPSGAVYSYTYDAAHRLTDIADNNNRIHYTLDAMGNRTKEETFDSANTLIRTHSRSFDALNRLYQDIGAINQTTTYAYDANGNLTGITDPLNRQSTNSYDALNRLISSTDATSGITRYGYDGQDQLVSVTDPKNLVTQYQRDGLGNLNQQTSPDTGITGHTYDAAGNVLTRTDAKGQVATYSYDALNRLTGIAYSSGLALQTVAYVYDQGLNGIGHLSQIVDSTGTTSYAYDQHGRLTTETRQTSATPSITYTTGYNYDTQGRLSGITYPSGRAVNYSFDGMGRISQVSTSYNGTTNILSSNIVYEPFGGVHGFTYGDGLTAPVQTYVRQRDQDGRIASYTLNGKAMSIGYDAASQISFITDPLNLGNTANYSYDPLSRLTSYTQSAISQGYSYDADGNRVSQTLGSTISTYGYVPGSNRLSSIQTGATTQSITQDGNGSTASDASRQYNYDLRGRLTQVTTAQGVINYEVNALGLRVRKQVPYANTDTLYHYDAAGHLIGESNAGSTQFTREYIYLNDQPVAVMQ
jgi:YD repeat-containing protein